MSWDDDWEDDDLPDDDFEEVFDPTPRCMNKRLFEDRIIRGLRKPFSYLTLTEMTREAVRLFSNTNAFLTSFEPSPAMTREMFQSSMIRKLAPPKPYDDIFAASGAKIGTTLRIRLPSNYKVR